MVTAAATAEARLVADTRTLSRFFAKVAMPSDIGACWPWTGCRDPRKGYGRFSNGGWPIYAHRSSYILAIGPIPARLQLDHLCKFTGCVNPLHLEPVTGHVNLMRGDSPSARNAVKTECHLGHPYDETNTLRQARGRKCRACTELGRYR